MTDVALRPTGDVIHLSGKYEEFKGWMNSPINTPAPETLTLEELLTWLHEANKLSALMQWRKAALLFAISSRFPDEYYQIVSDLDIKANEMYNLEYVWRAFRNVAPMPDRLSFGHHEALAVKGLRDEDRQRLMLLAADEGWNRATLRLQVKAILSAYPGRDAAKAGLPEWTVNPNARPAPPVVEQAQAAVRGPEPDDECPEAEADGPVSTPDDRGGYNLFLDASADDELDASADGDMDLYIAPETMEQIDELIAAQWTINGVTAKTPGDLIAAAIAYEHRLWRRTCG